jgi:N-acetylmuramoyl-L-alanine amidase
MDTPRETSPRRPLRFPAILQTTLLVAALVATLFTAFPPKGLFSANISEQISGMLTGQPEGVAVQGTPLPQVRIGIVAGHYGNDSGAVCENGITEVEINFKLATIVQQKLVAQGFQADVLEEFDPRLNNYRAAALVSIHNDSCTFVNDQATGFKVSAAMSARDMKLANRLSLCLRDRYQRVTGLPWHDSITNDMTYYHAFDEVSPNTPAAIIETGFMYLDYELLTQQPDLVAAGVVDGILCFVNNESILPAAP